MKAYKLLGAIGLIAVPVLAAAILFGGTVSAGTDISPGYLPTSEANESAVRKIITFINGLVGAIALLILVVNGLRYITSGGDPQTAAKAKNGIVFALIGIAIVVAAQAILSFVVTRLD